MRLSALTSSFVGGALGWRGLALLALGFVVLIFVNVVSIWSGQQLVEQTRRLDHSRDVRRVLDRTYGSLIEAENGQRAYLLTGEIMYAQEEERARLGAARSLASLRELVSDNPEQVGRLDEVRPLLEERLALTEQVIRHAAEGRAYQGLAIIRSGRGADLMQRIRRRFEAFDAVERALLDDRMRATTGAQNLNVWVSIVGAVLIFMIAVITLALHGRHIAQLTRARADLDATNRGLEERVRARTADLTAAHAEVERARDRAEAMLREVNHRVGNSLQLVSSFISLQARRLGEPAAGALKAAQARIEAVSQVHRRLYTSSDMDRVELDAYLVALADQLRQSLCAGPGACSLTVAAEPVQTSTDHAVAVGVLVAELVTNAVKYAYPETPGEIRIDLTDLGGARVRLTVEDDGVGLDGKGPKGTGLGGVIIAAMAKDLKTTVDYAARERGVSATLEFEI